MKVVLAAMTLVLAAACSAGTDSSASCVGPYVDARPAGGAPGRPGPTVAPGQAVTVYGHWYTDTCNDTNLSRQPLHPLAPVRLTVTLPGDEIATYGPLTPSGRDVGFRQEVPVPANVPAGTATVIDGLGSSFTFTVGGTP